MGLGGLRLLSRGDNVVEGKMGRFDARCRRRGIAVGNERERRVRNQKWGYLKGVCFRAIGAVAAGELGFPAVQRLVVGDRWVARSNAGAGMGRGAGHWSGKELIPTRRCRIYIMFLYLADRTSQDMSWRY